MTKAFVKHDYAVTGRDYVETEGGGDTPAGGISYSTTEQDTGLKWIDNKPIYQITYDISSITSSNTNLVDITSLGCENIVKIEGWVKGTETSYPCIIYSSETSQFVLFLSHSGGHTYIRGRGAVGSGSISNAFVTIWYTKTE